MSKSTTTSFKGCASFRHRIVCATLAGKAIRISDIRSKTDAPGLRDFEASFLRLIDKLTNGTAVEINDTGTKLRFRPGIIVGGAGLEHDCGKSRGVGWFVEGLLCLLPFAKNPVSITLKGLTNDDTCICVDTLRTVTLPLLKHFGIEQGLELRVVKRGARPDGGGEVVLRCPIVKELKPINLVNTGKIRRVRGVAYAARVSPQMPNRVVDSAKGYLMKVLPDVYVYTDHMKGAAAGSSPGYGISLVAESTEGCIYGADATAQPAQMPEDLGVSAAKMLIREVAMGGCVDTASQQMMLLLMVLCPEDVSKIRVGKLMPQTVQLLRLLRELFGAMFKMRPDRETGTLIMSCMGVGFKNIAKSIA